MYQCEIVIEQLPLPLFALINVLCVKTNVSLSLMFFLKKTEGGLKLLACSVHITKTCKIVKILK